MKIAIVDAGGTKTDWRIINNGVINQFVSAGFNASTDESEALKLSIPQEIQELEFDEVHFYVAGGNEQNKERLANQISNIITSKLVNVYPDTLAVARSLLNQSSGWVGILGTGSAAIHYNGATLDDRKASLGYILGDEGSGVDLGRRFISAYLRGQLDVHLTKQINENFSELSEAQTLTEVYQNGAAKSFLGQFAAFLGQNQNQPAIYRLVEKAFHSYFEGYFGGNLPEEMSFSGSIAFNFGNILNAVAKAKSIRIKRIIQSPIAGLTLYHQNHV